MLDNNIKYIVSCNTHLFYHSTQVINLPIMRKDPVFLVVYPRHSMCEISVKVQTSINVLVIYVYLICTPYCIIKWPFWHSILRGLVAKSRTLMSSDVVLWRHLFTPPYFHIRKWGDIHKSIFISIYICLYTYFSVDYQLKFHMKWWYFFNGHVVTP